jgi:hypothetical protein
MTPWQSQDPENGAPSRLVKLPRPSRGPPGTMTVSPNSCRPPESASKASLSEGLCRDHQADKRPAGVARGSLDQRADADLQRADRLAAVAQAAVRNDTSAPRSRSPPWRVRSRRARAVRADPRRAGRCRCRSRDRAAPTRAMASATTISPKRAGGACYLLSRGTLSDDSRTASAANACSRRPRLGDHAHRTSSCGPTFTRHGPIPPAGLDLPTSSRSSTDDRRVRDVCNRRLAEVGG